MQILQHITVSGTGRRYPEDPHNIIRKKLPQINTRVIPGF